MIEIEVKVPDKPGMLVKLIQPISENSGNIHGIIHNHKENKEGRIPVLVTFELHSEDKLKSLEKIKEGLRSLDFDLIKISDIPACHYLTVLLSGHVFRQSFEDTIRRLEATGVKIKDMEALFKGADEISNVKFNVEIPDELEDDGVISTLEKICREKNLELIMEEKLL